MRPTTVRHYWRSVRIPLAFAAGCILYVLTIGREAPSRYGLTIPQVVVIYLAGALYVGLAIALFRSWASSRLRAAVLGFGCGAVAALAFNFLVAGPHLDLHLQGLGLLLYMAFVGLFPGAFAGALFWEKDESG